MKRITLTFWLVVCLLIIRCAPTIKTESVVDSTWHNKLDKVMVVIIGSIANETFNDN